MNVLIGSGKIDVAKYTVNLDDLSDELTPYGFIFGARLELYAFGILVPDFTNNVTMQVIVQDEDGYLLYSADKIPKHANTFIPDVAGMPLIGNISVLTGPSGVTGGAHPTIYPVVFKIWFK